MLKIKLNYFDEGNDNGAESNDNGAEVKSFEDILKENKDYQSEFDKKIAKALETAKSKWKSETETLINEAKTEAEKLAKMNAEEKAKHEAEKREQSLQERENAIAKRELKATAIDTLNEKGMPTELCEILNYASADSCKESIEAVEKIFSKAVEKAVTEKLKGNVAMKKAKDDDVNTLEEQIKKSMGIKY